MRLLIFAALLSASPSFAAVLVANLGGDSVRLTDQPCTNAAVLERLNQGARADYYAGSAIVSAERFAACWRVMGDTAHIVYEDGDQGLVPLRSLKPANDEL